MGFVMGMGICIGCGANMTFNPVKVPSIRHPETGEKEPLCRSCFDRWNVIHRICKGLDPIPLQDGAYGSCGEDELP